MHEELGAVGDLNGDGKDEVALVWLTMGPTYWRNTLTVFTPVASGEYTTENDSTFSLIGEAKAPQIKDGVILIEQVVHAENDPICCPTVQKTGKYKWENKKLAEVK
ncbi:MAG: FG-GAP repeat protein [Micavibrio sp.]|nr:FG-GAP repeat protein [Micavibrio sp.]MBK9562181.1 FG-GAP repeat protein [Micavibrio sp.]